MEGSKEASEGGKAAYRLTWSTRLPPFSSQFPLVENVVGFLQLIIIIIIIIIIMLLLDIKIFLNIYFSLISKTEKKKKKKKIGLGFVDSSACFEPWD
jgi:hypothetical protein